MRFAGKLAHRHLAVMAVVALLALSVGLLATPTMALGSCNTAESQVASSCCPPGPSCPCPMHKHRDSHTQATYQCGGCASPPATLPALGAAPAQLDIHEHFFQTALRSHDVAADSLGKTGARRCSDPASPHLVSASSLAMLSTIVLLA